MYLADAYVINFIMIIIFFDKSQKLIPSRETGTKSVKEIILTHVLHFPQHHLALSKIVVPKCLFNYHLVYHIWRFLERISKVNNNLCIYYVWQADTIRGIMDIVYTHVGTCGLYITLNIGTYNIGTHCLYNTQNIGTHCTYK